MFYRTLAVLLAMPSIALAVGNVRLDTVDAEGFIGFVTSITLTGTVPANATGDPFLSACISWRGTALIESITWNGRDFARSAEHNELSGNRHLARWDLFHARPGASGDVVVRFVDGDADLVAAHVYAVEGIQNAARVSVATGAATGSMISATLPFFGGTPLSLDCVSHFLLPVPNPLPDPKPVTAEQVELPVQVTATNTPTAMMLMGSRKVANQAMQWRDGHSGGRSIIVATSYESAEFAPVPALSTMALGVLALVLLGLGLHRRGLATALALLILSACDDGGVAIDPRAVRAPESAPVMLFSDGFESGSRSAWSHVDGPASYVSTECRSGLFCGAMQMVGGRDQQSIYWAKQVAHSGETFRASAWWRFPKGFSWDPGGQPWGLEHKMMIVNTTDGVGRVLLNLRGGGESPEIAVHFERLESYGDAPGPVSRRSGVRWPADGQWHQFEIEITRRSGTGRAQVWLDGKTVIDEAGRVCGSPCAPIRDVQFGAFSNQGAPRNQTFYLDDALVAAVPRVAVLPPVPQPPPLPPAPPAPPVPPVPPAPPAPPAPDPSRALALEAIARATDELAEARKRLEAVGAELEASAKALGGAK